MTRRLLLVHEPPDDCLARLVRAGIAPAHAGEIASYLDQSTDIAPDFSRIAEECDARKIAFSPVRLDDLAKTLAACEPAGTLVWTLTDGIAYFRGSAAPALARLGGFPAFGADDALFALAQDKFRSGAVLAALGLPVPPAGLARDGAWLAPPPPSQTGWFVKPNRLGAKIGIWEESRCESLEQALSLSRRIFAAYRDDAVVQPYVAGRNARASFLAVEAQAGPERLGAAFVESGSDFQTMRDSLALYGRTGAAANAGGLRREPGLASVGEAQPEAERRVKTVAATLMRALGLRDVFSLDFRIDADGAVHLIEFEVCPGLPCFDFRAYCRKEWGSDLAGAMACAAAARLERAAIAAPAP